MTSIIAPNKYELSYHVTVNKLIANGFKKTGDTYHKKKWLSDLVYVEIEIDLKERWMVYFVKTSNFDNYYAHFYEPPEDMQDNEVYRNIVNKFNRYMDALCWFRILWRKDYKPLKRIGRKRGKDR